MITTKDQQASVASCLAAVLFILSSQCHASSLAGTSYRGMAEASAAVMLDERHFVVAEDECNTLLIYQRGQSQPVGSGLDLAKFLKTGDKASDIEGGARLGDIVYWISSHSLPKSGKPREWRKQFFATRIVRSGAAPTLVPYQQPYTGLLEAMHDASELKDLKLSKAAKLPPEQRDGLNIEGLAPWKADSLLIGFRTPLISGKALLVPLTNPAAVVQGSQAKFDHPILVDLNGRGVRSIDKLGSEYVIVAGPIADKGTFAIFRWSGDPGQPPEILRALPEGYFPEALLSAPGSNEVDILSDDGSRQPAAACHSPAKAPQQFRTLHLRLP